MAEWNPWRGCRKYSEGCKYCYIHKGDARRGVDTNEIVRSENDSRFTEYYVKGEHKGEPKVKSGEMVYLCFRSDFLIVEADEWRNDCWDIIRKRSDLTFLFLTKRIDRFMDCIPDDWGDGYENVVVGCTVENQKQADYRLSIFDKLPIKHKIIICQPMIEAIDLSGHLSEIESVEVGGESDKDARPLDYTWVLAVREQCLSHHVNFTFRQCGSHFQKDGVMYNLNPFQLCSQAKKANIDLKF